MSTHVNPPSQTSDVLTSGNGLDEHTETKSSERKYEYELEDFSQSIINRHQQYINYELVEVNKATVKALETLRDVLPSGPAVNAVQVAIDAVKKANDKVAGWYPPGCKDGESATGKPGGTTGGDPGSAIKQTT